MLYFLDTEFIESGPNEPIHLISIGIVAEDDRELYLQNADCPLEKASDWVKKNVIPNLQCKPYEDIEDLHISGPAAPFFINRSEHKTYNLSTNCIDNIWLRLKDIGKILVDFIGNDSNIQFWGYYADYDWVVFCQIFGTMMDLPQGYYICEVCLNNIDKNELEKDSIEEGRLVHRHNNFLGTTQLVGKFPMYCNDIKQLAVRLGNPTLPKQEGIEHNALADARWNKKAYEFLKQYTKENELYVYGNIY